MTARTWPMFAGRPTDGAGEFEHFGEQWYVHAYGNEPNPVVLTEDPDGGYWGWIDYDDGRDSAPVMIQPHHGMFTLQFPYGPEIEVKHGRGEIVRMSCRAVDQEVAQ